MQSLVTSLVLCGCLLAMPAFANPSRAADPAVSFKKMDTNADSKIMPEEFFAAYKDMKEAAFQSIDENKDGAISLEEWSGFAKSHGAAEQAVHAPMSNSTQKGPDLLMPAGDAKNCCPPQ